MNHGVRVIDEPILFEQHCNVEVEDTAVCNDGGVVWTLGMWVWWVEMVEL